MNLFCMTGARLALDLVNQDKNTLPSHTLELLVYDTQCEYDVAMNHFISLVQRRTPPIAGILGIVYCFIFLMYPFIFLDQKRTPCISSMLSMLDCNVFLICHSMLLVQNGTSITCTLNIIYCCTLYHFISLVQKKTPPRTNIIAIVCCWGFFPYIIMSCSYFRRELHP